MFQQSVDAWLSHIDFCKQQVCVFLLTFTCILLSVKFVLLLMFVHLCVITGRQESRVCTGAETDAKCMMVFPYMCVLAGMSAL